MDRWIDISIIALTQIIMLVGLIGLFVPVFPGLFIIWLAAFGYGVIEGFGTVGIVIMILITIIGIAGSMADNVLMGAGARHGGASWLTIGVALTAGILGTIFFPPFGGIIAAPLAIVLLEFIRLGDIKKAWRALQGLATGWGISFLARFGFGIAMIALWWIWVWQG
jgi:uncharacterized protein YqgC (DUF456 family)